jgi:uncharacterized membrane protein
MRGASRSTGVSRELWTWPAAGTGIGAGLAFLMLNLSRSLEMTYPRVVWPGDSDAASSMLQVIAGAVITVITLSFSLMVIALQLASQQFSPRLLRDFTRDRITRAVLAILMATFVYALTVLRSLNQDRPLPELAVSFAFVLGLTSLGAVIGFITHIARILRVDIVMTRVHAETADAIARFHPRYGDEPAPGELSRRLDQEGSDLVTAGRSGFLRHIHVDDLVRAGERADAYVRVEVHTGDRITRGTPIGSVWTPAPGRGADPRVDAALRAALHLDDERAIDQDAAFGFRQLEDIAVKALSPGVNDPVTCTHAIGHLADLLVTLCARRLGPTVHADSAGRGRVIVPGRDLRYYLDLACGEVRHYGRGMPTVLKALLAMLRDVAAAARDDAQRAEIGRQVGFVQSEIPASMPAHDAEQVHDMARRVRQVLAGQVRAGFADRCGETRST